MRKVLYHFVAVMCLIVCCAGCSGQPDKPPETTDTHLPGWQLHAEDKASLDWYINFSWYNTVWGESLVSKTITEETGIDINFMAPVGNEVQTLDALIASDMLPDLVTLGWWEPQINDLVTGGYVYAINQLADRYDPYFYTVAGNAQLTWYTYDDGNVYCYPNSSYSPYEYEEYGNTVSNQTFLVRKDIYEAIGSPDMTTAEGFTDAVRKAAQMYPTIDGEPIIPIGVHEFDSSGCFSFGPFLMNLLAVPYEKDGKYYDRYSDPDYIEWLKTFRMLGEEGYLSSDIFIDKRVQMEEKIAAGRYFCMIFQRTDIVEQQNMLYQKNPDSVYIAVDGPQNKNKDPHTLSAGGIYGWTVTLISKNCERPDRAIELLSYLISEHGQRMVYLGVEGITYDTVNGHPTVRPEILELKNKDRREYDRLYGADDTYWMLQNNAMQAQWEPKLSPHQAQLIDWASQYTVYTGQYDVYFRTNSEESIVDEKIKKLWGATLPKLLLAKSEEEFDLLWEQFLQTRDSYGFKELMNQYTKQMVRSKQLLGIE